MTIIEPLIVLGFCMFFYYMGKRHGETEMNDKIIDAILDHLKKNKMIRTRTDNNGELEILPVDDK